MNTKDELIDFALQEYIDNQMADDIKENYDLLPEDYMEAERTRLEGLTERESKNELLEALPGWAEFAAAEDKKEGDI